MNEINFFYNKSKKKYQNRNLSFKPEELKKIIENLYRQANENYQKLPDPRYCSLKAYVSIWINDGISEDIARKGVKPIKTNNPPDNFKATIDFYQEYPPSSIKKIKQKDFNDIRKKWLLVVEERNKFAKKKGYKSKLDMSLKNFNIPKSEYNKFLKNVNKIIDLYPKTTKNIDRFCPICNNKLFSFKTLDDFLIFYKKKNTFYKENKNKIKIHDGNYSETKYIKETDVFDIEINQKNNINHQILDLIHELAHVNSMAKILKQNKFVKTGAYFLEKVAIEEEIIFLKKYFPEVLKIKLINIKRIICQTLFEIEIYKNPKKDPNKIYLQYLKKMSEDVIKLDDWNYLFNQDILYKDFSQLIYAMAYVNTLVYFLIKYEN